MAANRDWKLGRALSYLLRHGLDEVPYDRGGWVLLQDLQRHPSCRYQEVEAFQRVVTNDNKGRFELVGGKIRAVQGHKAGLNLDPALLGQTPILSEQQLGQAEIVHGTYVGAWDAIVRSGCVKPMEREHVHFARATPEAGVVSVARSDADVFIWVSVKQLLESGAKLMESRNGVLLVAGEVPTSCISRAVAAQGVVLAHSFI